MLISLFQAELLLKRSALVIYSRSTCFCTAVQSPVWNSASPDSSPIRISRICLINILNYSFWLFLQPVGHTVDAVALRDTSTFTARTI